MILLFGIMVRTLFSKLWVVFSSLRSRESGTRERKSLQLKEAGAEFSRGVGVGAVGFGDSGVGGVSFGGVGMGAEVTEKLRVWLIVAEEVFSLEPVSARSNFAEA